MWFRLYFKMFVMCRYYFIDRDMAKEICFISIIKKKILFSYLYKFLLFNRPYGVYHTKLQFSIF